jgi:hypothetical protein
MGGDGRSYTLSVMTTSPFVLLLGIVFIWSRECKRKKKKGKEKDIYK